MDSCVSANGLWQRRKSNSTARRIEGTLWRRSTSFSPRCNGSMKAVAVVEGLEVLGGPGRKGFLSARLTSMLPSRNAQSTSRRDQYGALGVMAFRKGTSQPFGSRKVTSNSSHPWGRGALISAKPDLDLPSL